MFDLQSLMQNVFVLPITFNREHKNMLAHCKKILEYNHGNVTIHPRFTELITALRTVVENGEVCKIKKQLVRTISLTPFVCLYISGTLVNQQRPEISRCPDMKYGKNR